MGVLGWLTLGVVAAIVAVLAVYLTLIARSLYRANRNLEQLVSGLEQARDNTAPLGDDLAAVNEAAITLRTHLTSVDRHLGGLAGQGE